MEARTWAKDADEASIGNSLRGPHTRFIMWLLDETGDYPDAIMPVCENIFSGLPQIGRIVQAGNPTQLSGPLYKACTSAKSLWNVIEITGDPDDPKRSPRVSIEHARNQIAQYGRDSAWVMVNILGKFPPSSLNSLIGPDEVRAAMGRYYRDYELRESSKVIGIDVAREGLDQSVLAKRQGLQMFPFIKHRNIDGIQGAGVTSREWGDWNADACFVDNTGGFGSSWIDQLRILGRAAIPVNFSSNAHQNDRYFNKRTEMIWEFVEWIKRGGALPDDDKLLQALVSTTYSFKGDRMLMEPKELVKKKMGGHSPDEMDAAILCFAEEVSPANRQVRRPNQSAIAGGYDPFKEINQASAVGGNYDAFRN